MRLTSRIAWRSLASRPGRTLTSVLGIAVGVAAVLSVLIVDHNTILTEQSGRLSRSGRPDLEIRPVEAGTPEMEVPEALRRDRDLRDVAPVFFSRIRMLREDQGAGGSEPAAPQDLELVALRAASGEQFDAFRLAEGETFTADDAREALLPRSLAEELSLEVGDTLFLQRATPSVTECQDGVMVQVKDERIETEPEPFRLAGLLEIDHLGRRRAVLIPYSTGLELFEGAHIQPLYWARLNDGAIYQDVRERLKASYIVDKPRGALVGERVDQRAFRKSIRMAACLSLLLGLFVIYNAFSLSLVERVREIGLLRALGLKAGEIAYAVLLEGFVLALMGAASGLVLSFGVVLVMKRLGITSLGWGKPLVLTDVPWDVVCVILAAGVVAAMLGVIAPLFRVRSLSVIEAVRAGQIAYKPDPTRFIRALVLALLPGALVLLFVVATPPLGERQEEVFRVVTRVAVWLSLTFGLVLLLPRLIQGAVLLVLRLVLAGRPIERPIAVASTRGSHHRVFGSTVGIALVLAALLAIHGITESLKDESARFSERTLSGRVFVQSAMLPKRLIEPAARAEGVVDFYSLSAEVHSPFPIRGVDPVHVLRWVDSLKDDPQAAREFSEGRSIVLSESLAQNYGYRIGDQVRLSTYASAYPVRVAAISDAFGYFPDDRQFGVLALDTFRSLFCVDDERGGQYVFHVDEDSDPSQAAATIASLLPSKGVFRVRSGALIKRFYLADMNRDFWIFRVILVLTCALAFVGLWNSLTVALLERRREIGLLRTLGFTPGQLGGMLAAESCALGLVGGILALLAGLPISHDLVEGIRIISRLDVQYVVTPFDALLVPLAAVLLALIATVPPALRVRSLVVASATRME